mgnify:CR=1 FL=1
MKHSLKITLILLAMFFLTQLIGLAVINAYRPEVKDVVLQNGSIVEKEVYNLPYGMNPPEETTPKTNLISIFIAIGLAVVIMLFLMKYRLEIFFRIWFFLVVALAIGITLNSLLLDVPYSSLISFLIAIPISFIKIFKRNIVVHNLTELLIYPGIAAIFVPLLTVWTVVILLVVISIYDIYAVWHAGFMQKMAKYQIHKLKLFSGFFIPYLGKKERELMRSNSKSKNNQKKIKVSVAILGGGDVVFPIILSGVVFLQFGLISALIVSIGATLALASLFYASQKGKFYPAMPFISAGCFIALILVYLIR